jgi:hypothetical protein
MTQDAQREMEQRALRNVRGLVEKIESSDELEARKQRKVLYWIVGAALAIALVAAIAMATSSRNRTEIVVDPARLPPVQAGPQR